ncbi:MAG: hypothetical protein KDA99_28580 [Planctomycetales bacterium]|nr:hypothetical protein [Planctomycetales bacterium]
MNSLSSSHSMAYHRRSTASWTIAVLTFVVVTGTDAVGQGPGFRGGRGPDPAFVADRDVFHFLLTNHEKIRRTVEETPQGVVTVTESDDPEVTAKIQEHVDAMHVRLEKPSPIRMPDPLFAAIFRNADKVTMTWEDTEHGVRVTETSEDPYVVLLIQAHAKVVSGFVASGFDEAHRSHPAPPRKQATDTAEKDRWQAFVEFDRRYIPALALTNQGEQARAAAALTAFEEIWNERLAGELLKRFHDDPAWPATFSRISGAIAVAQQQLQEGHTKEAHESLEPIRSLMAHTRQRNGIEYPLDLLAAFHDTMELIVKPAMELTPETLEDEQIDVIRKACAKASAEWQAVEEAHVDVRHLGKAQGDQDKFQQMVIAQRHAIVALQQAITSQDKQAIVQRARGLKPPFAKLYMFFGEGLE